MKVKLIKTIHSFGCEYEALEDGVITTNPKDHPTFDLESLQDMKIFVRKGEKFQLTEEYIPKNNLDLIMLVVQTKEEEKAKP